MRKRKLIAHRNDGRTGHSLSHVPLTFNAGDIDWHCPKCDALIFGQTHDGQHYDVLIECHRCRSVLGMPAAENLLAERLRVVADNGGLAHATADFAADGPRPNVQLA